MATSSCRQRHLRGAAGRAGSVVDFRQELGTVLPALSMAGLELRAGERCKSESMSQRGKQAEHS